MLQTSGASKIFAPMFINMIKKEWKDAKPYKESYLFRTMDYMYSE